MGAERRSGSECIRVSLLAAVAECCRVASRPVTCLKRILVIGSGGSGKTTFARRLAERTTLPLIHLDALYWRPGWDPTPADEWRARVEALANEPAWIMDGNYGGTLDIRLAASDTIVFLD